MHLPQLSFQPSYYAHSPVQALNEHMHICHSRLASRILDDMMQVISKLEGSGVYEVRNVL